MTKRNLLATLLFVPLGLNAQDIIVLRNGDLIQSKVQEITQHEIKYKKFSNPDGPLYTIDKTTVLSINYQNGEKETFNSETTPVKSQPTSSIEIGYEDPVQNARCIAAVNNACMEYVGKAGNKKASILVCKLSVTPTSTLSNKDIELRFTSGGSKSKLLLNPADSNYISKTDRWLAVFVKNKTDKTIYIDLANTFFKRGGQSVPYYIPSSTTTSSTHSTGVGINIGGVLGPVGGGISAGGGRSTTTATTTFSQRIVAIPPHSEKKLDAQYLFPEGCEAYYDGVQREIWVADQYHACIDVKCKRGEHLSWDASNSPITCGMLLTYAFDEAFEEKASLNVDMYMSDAIGGRFFWGDKTCIVADDFLALPDAYFIVETGKATRGVKLDILPGR